MDSTLTRVIGFAISLLSGVFLFKQVHLPGWETPATIAGIIFVFVFAVIIGATWKQPIFDSFMLSFFIVGFIWLFIFPAFGLVLLLLFGLGLLIFASI
jgi:hypothetical protein